MCLVGVSRSESRLSNREDLGNIIHAEGCRLRLGRSSGEGATVSTFGCSCGSIDLIAQITKVILADLKIEDFINDRCEVSKRADEAEMRRAAASSTAFSTVIMDCEIDALLLRCFEGLQGQEELQGQLINARQTLREKDLLCTLHLTVTHARLAQ